LKIENQESLTAAGVAAAHNLSSDMPPEPGVWQRIDNVSDARRETPKSL
jgi:hypothetical protein